ncbi:MAG: hypothetical protein KIT27_04020 [Legionellales bacterium]|nr:hypothetical protein [Legionellales bacterium]
MLSVSDIFDAIDSENYADATEYALTFFNEISKLHSEYDDGDIPFSDFIEFYIFKLFQSRYLTYANLALFYQKLCQWNFQDPSNDNINSKHVKIIKHKLQFCVNYKLTIFGIKCDQNGNISENISDDDVIDGELYDLFSTGSCHLTRNLDLKAKLLKFENNEISDEYLMIFSSDIKIYQHVRDLLVYKPKISETDLKIIFEYYNNCSFEQLQHELNYCDETIDFYIDSILSSEIHDINCFDQDIKDLKQKKQLIQIALVKQKLNNQHELLDSLILEFKDLPKDIFVDELLLLAATHYEYEYVKELLNIRPDVRSTDREEKLNRYAKNFGNLTIEQCCIVLKNKLARYAERINNFIHEISQSNIRNIHYFDKEITRMKKNQQVIAEKVKCCQHAKKLLGMQPVINREEREAILQSYVKFLGVRTIKECCTVLKDKLANYTERINNFINEILHSNIRDIYCFDEEITRMKKNQQVIAEMLKCYQHAKKLLNMQPVVNPEEREAILQRYAEVLRKCTVEQCCTLLKNKLTSYAKRIEHCIKSILSPDTRDIYCFDQKITRMKKKQQVIQQLLNVYKSYLQLVSESSISPVQSEQTPPTFNNNTQSSNETIQPLSILPSGGSAVIPDRNTKDVKEKESKQNTLSFNFEALEKRVTDYQEEIQSLESSRFFSFFYNKDLKEYKKQQLINLKVELLNTDEIFHIKEIISKFLKDTKLTRGFDGRALQIITGLIKQFNQQIKNSNSKSGSYCMNK